MSSTMRKIEEEIGELSITSPPSTTTREVPVRPKEPPTAWRDQVVESDIEWGRIYNRLLLGTFPTPPLFRSHDPSVSNRLKAFVFAKYQVDWFRDTADGVVLFQPKWYPHTGLVIHLAETAPGQLAVRTVVMAAENRADVGVLVASLNGTTTGRKFTYSAGLLDTPAAADDIAVDPTSLMPYAVRATVAYRPDKTDPAYKIERIEVGSGLRAVLDRNVLHHRVAVIITHGMPFKLRVAGRACFAPLLPGAYLSTVGFSTPLTLFPSLVITWALVFNRATRIFTLSPSTTNRAGAANSNGAALFFGSSYPNIVVESKVGAKLLSALPVAHANDPHDIDNMDDDYSSVDYTQGPDDARAYEFVPVPSKTPAPAGPAASVMVRVQLSGMRLTNEALENETCALEIDDPGNKFLPTNVRHAFLVIYRTVIDADGSMRYMLPMRIGFDLVVPNRSHAGGVRIVGLPFDIAGSRGTFVTKEI